MAYAEPTTPRMRAINEEASLLANEWRRLTRAGTFVALLTAPAFFLILYDSNRLSWLAAPVIPVLAVLIFRGIIEVVARKLIPGPSLYAADESVKADDVVARRRYWWWRREFRRVPLLGAVVVD